MFAEKKLENAIKDTLIQILPFSLEPIYDKKNVT